MPEKLQFENCPHEHLIVIGVQKGGTTFLHDLFEDSSNFFCPSVKTEIHFFDHDKLYSQGFEAYFELYDKSNDEKFTVDVTPDYFSNRKACERLIDFVKKCDKPVKIILSLREPSSRLFSAYQLGLGRGWYNCSFKDAMEKRPELLQGSDYSNLSFLLENIASENFHVIILERINTDKERFFIDLKTFLNIETISSTNAGANKSFQPKSRWMYNKTVKFNLFLRKTFGGSFILSLKKIKFVNWLYTLNKAQSSE
jgi:hypothetical protein